MSLMVLGSHRRFLGEKKKNKKIGICGPVEESGGAAEKQEVACLFSTGR